jgi:hypothetical protein
MASATGMGTTVAFGTQTTFTPELVSVSHNGVTVEDVETSHLGTTGTKTYIAADLKEGGELSCEIHFLGSQNPTIGGSPETITIDWSGTGDSWTFSGYIKSFSANAAMGPELMSGTMVIKAAGAVTFNV